MVLFFSEFSVFQEARKQGITVMLCGQGPDEHSAGYTNYFTYYNLELLKKFKYFELYKYFKQKGFKEFLNFIGFLFINRFKNFSNNFLNYNYFKKKSSRHPIGLFSKINTIRKLSLEQVFSSSIPYQAHSEDRNSMCFSIESRSPYLDHNLLEFAVRLPSNFKLQANKNKFILRETLKSYLPKEVYDRNDKMGFVAPDEIWFRENKIQIRPFLIDSCSYLGDLINMKSIIDHYDEFIKGDKKYNNIFLKVMSLAVLLKLYNINFQKLA